MAWGSLSTNLQYVEFDGLDAPTSDKVSEKWRYAVHPLLKGNPKLQAIGKELTERTLNIRFESAQGDPQIRLEYLRELAITQSSLVLTVGGNYEGLFVIKSLDYQTITALGDRPLSIDVKVGLLEVGDD